MKTPLQTINAIEFAIKDATTKYKNFHPSQFRITQLVLNDLGNCKERYPHEFERFLLCLPQLANPKTFARILRSKSVIALDTNNNWKALAHLLSYLPPKLKELVAKSAQTTTDRNSLASNRRKAQTSVANKLWKEELNEKLKLNFQHPNRSTKK